MRQFARAGRAPLPSQKQLQWSELRVGITVLVAAVLEGVDIGNVTAVRIVPNHGGTPVEVAMKLSTKYNFNLRKDSVTSLSTVGVLGETYIDIDSSQAKGPEARDGDVLAIRDHPDIQDVVRASQGTLQNMDALLKRLDRIVAARDQSANSSTTPRSTTASRKPSPTSRAWSMKSATARAVSASSLPLMKPTTS